MESGKGHRPHPFLKLPDAKSKANISVIKTLRKNDRERYRTSVSGKNGKLKDCDSPGYNRDQLPPDATVGRPKIGFVSLGCPKNLVDSEVMMGLLHAAGGELTPTAEDAEILVVNTCSFIDSAKQESVNTILEMVQHKQANGGRAQKLIVAGCLVERYRDEIQKNIPEVDAVVGTGELEAILTAAGLAPKPAAQQDSPFNILPQGLVSRAHSAVHQHSHPTEQGAQLEIERASKIRCPTSRF